jgi:hypothetical protein
MGCMDAAIGFIFDNIGRYDERQSRADIMIRLGWKMVDQMHSNFDNLASLNLPSSLFSCIPNPIVVAKPS